MGLHYSYRQTRPLSQFIPEFSDPVSLAITRFDRINLKGDPHIYYCNDATHRYHNICDQVISQGLFLIVDLFLFFYTFSTTNSREITVQSDAVAEVSFSELMSSLIHWVRPALWLKRMTPWTTTWWTLKVIKGLCDRTSPWFINSVRPRKRSRRATEMKYRKGELEVHVSFINNYHNYIIIRLYLLIEEPIFSEIIRENSWSCTVFLSINSC